MSLGPMQIALIILLVLVFFGRGRISEMMGDVGKGIKSFKKGISEEEETPAAPKQIDVTPAAPAADTSATKDEAKGG